MDGRGNLVKPYNFCSQPKIIPPGISQCKIKLQHFIFILFSCGLNRNNSPAFIFFDFKKPFSFHHPRHQLSMPP